MFVVELGKENKELLNLPKSENVLVALKTKWKSLLNKQFRLIFY